MCACGVNSMEKKKYLLVEASVLPQVFLRVLKAKELLAGEGAKNVSQAVRLAGISRSAYYKYRDSVFRANTGEGIVTLTTSLLDETGALQALLAGISAAGAGVVTINQSVPEDGAATATVTVRTDGMRMTLDELCASLKKQRTVVDIRANG